MPEQDVQAKAEKLAALVRADADARASIEAGTALRTDAAYVRSQLEPLGRALTARRARNAVLQKELQKLKGQAK